MASSDITRLLVPTTTLYHMGWPLTETETVATDRCPTTTAESRQAKCSWLPEYRVYYFSTKNWTIVPGPWGPPFRRPILKTTARSYSWTTLNVKQRENGRVIIIRMKEPMVAKTSMNLLIAVISCPLNDRRECFDSSGGWTWNKMVNKWFRKIIFFKEYQSLVISRIRNFPLSVQVVYIYALGLFISGNKSMITLRL